MMDQFLEEVVVKHKTGPRTLMIVAANILMVLFALFAFIFLFYCSSSISFSSVPSS